MPARVVGVQLEERLLEPGGLDQQVDDGVRRDRRQERLRVALEVAREARPVDRDGGHTRHGREVGRIALELQLDAPLAAGEERGDVLVRDEPARSDDGHAIAHALDLGQHVRREQHRPAGRAEVSRIA